MYKGRGLHGRTTNPSAGLSFLFISRHFYRYRSSTFCFSCSYILTHHYQASLLSPLVNLLSSETSIKHWWLERIILLTCFSWNMATLRMIYVIHRLWTKTDMKMVSMVSEPGMLRKIVLKHEPWRALQNFCVLSRACEQLNNYIMISLGLEKLFGYDVDGCSNKNKGSRI